MKRTVVISRYNEPIDWIKKIKCDYIIFNKGEAINDPEIAEEKIINLENWGREAETFLRYIVQNYKTLSEETVFVQGNPFDHFPNTLEFINSKDNNDNLISLGNSTSCDINGFPSYPNLPIELIIRAIIPNFGESTITFTAGAQWIVNKKFILNKSESWWISLYELFTFYWFSGIPSGFNKNPGEFVAHIMERLWGVIYHYEEVRAEDLRYI